MQVHTRRADHSGHEGLVSTAHRPDRHRLLPTDRRDDISLDVDRYEDPMAARKDWVPGLVGLEIDIGEGETSEATPTLNPAPSAQLAAQASRFGR